MNWRGLALQAAAPERWAILLRQASELGAAGNTGGRAEAAACRHLEQHGLAALARNYRCRLGEIDLVMQDGATVVFVEVRYRRTRRFGSAAETVDARKQARVIAAAQHYLQSHPDAARRPCRFDVVAVEDGQEAFRFEWYKNAFALN